MNPWLALLVNVIVAVLTAWLLGPPIVREVQAWRLAHALQAAATREACR